MSDSNNDLIGAAWLVHKYQLVLSGCLPVQSQIGGRRLTHSSSEYTQEIYPERMRPAAEPVAQLQFHLRHEVPHLEFLSRLFERTGADFIQAWVNAEPTGQYARRAAFLYEWLTGQNLQVPPRLGGNYVDAIDDQKMVAASSDQVIKVPRWRINDNLPGTRYFCPTVLKTAALTTAMALNVSQLVQKLQDEFDEDLLQRAAVWMTLRESKASFEIEGEASQASRIERFAEVMARRTGQSNSPLSPTELAQLQQDILGERTTLTHFGLRQSPVFVGESVRYQDIVHYVAPPVEDIAAMLEGLQTFLERTQGQSSIMRSAVVAFGFVYIHPLADGNGRIHRFLVNDVLRRDGVVPDPIILPISAVITDDVGERRHYDQVLDQVSKPLMQKIRDSIAFKGQYMTYPDGVVSNFDFNGNAQARPAWRYLDLSPHVAYLSEIVARTLTEHMREQSRYLFNHRRARQALKEIVEMPDSQADRILRSIEQNNGMLSNKLAKDMPILSRPGIWEQITEAVAQAFR